MSNKLEVLSYLSSTKLQNQIDRECLNWDSAVRDLLILASGGGGSSSGSGREAGRDKAYLQEEFRKTGERQYKSMTCVHK